MENKFSNNKPIQIFINFLQLNSFYLKQTFILSTWFDPVALPILQDWAIERERNIKCTHKTCSR